MKTYKAVLFDVDGTLLDTSAGLRASAQVAIGEMGLAPLGEEQLRRVFSANAHLAFQEFYGLTDQEAGHMGVLYRTAYKERFFTRMELFPGTREMLEALRSAGYILATASLKREDFCRALFEHVDILPYFDTLSGQNETYTLRKKDIVVQAAERLGLGVEDCLLVGDSIFDAEGAAQAGCDFMAVTYGFGFRAPGDVAPWPMAHCAASAGEIADILRR